VLTEYPEEADPGVGGGSGSLDLSPPGDIEGLGPRWESVRGEGATLACSSSGSGAGWFGLMVLPLALRRRG